MGMTPAQKFWTFQRAFYWIRCKAQKIKNRVREVKTICDGDIDNLISSLDMLALVRLNFT